MSMETNMIAKLLEKDFFAFRKRVLFVKGFGIDGRQFILRWIGNASEPGTDTYSRRTDREDPVTIEDAFVEDPQIKEMVENDQLTILGDWSASDFILKNKFGKTLDELRDQIIEVEVPDGYRAHVSSKEYDVFSILYDALDLKLLDPWVVHDGKRNIEFLTCTMPDPMKLNKLDPKTWKKIVTQANNINKRARERFAKLEKKEEK